MKLRTFFLLAVLFSALIWAAAPAMSRAVLAQAEAHSRFPFLMSVLVDGKLGAGGWMESPSRAYAEVSDPQVVVTYSVNGGPVTEGREVWLATPGQYQIAWTACKEEICHEPYLQHVQIAFMQAKPLSYDQAWRFTGQVLAVQNVSLLGFPASVARVQSRHFAVWVAQQVGYIQLASAPVKPGDWVQVSIAGPHVSAQAVDWQACPSSRPDYCAYGAALDSGLESPDTPFPLSPSNELIHFNRASNDWHKALFWNTSLLDKPETAH